jgi:hypothetical protein
LLLVLLLVASSFQPALLLPASSRQPNGYITAFDAPQQPQSLGGRVACDFALHCGSS